MYQADEWEFQITPTPSAPFSQQSQGKIVLPQGKSKNCLYQQRQRTDGSCLGCSLSVRNGCSALTLWPPPQGWQRGKSPSKEDQDLPCRSCCAFLKRHHRRNTVSVRQICSSPAVPEDGLLGKTKVGGLGTCCSLGLVPPQCHTRRKALFRLSPWQGGGDH